METACNRHTDVALSPEGLGRRLAQIALHYALMLRASTALVGIPLQYPCTLSDDWGGGGGGGTACGRYRWSGGTDYSGTNGPGEPFIPDMDGPG